MTRSTNRWTFCWPAMLLFGFLAISTPAALPAQVVHGIVLDSLTSVPMKGVVVDLMSPQSIVAKVTSDDSGHFSVRVPKSDTYRFRVLQIGYHDYLSKSVPIDASRDATVTLRLFSLPVAVQGLHITASSELYLEHSGFYQRKQSDPGYFMDPDAMIAAASKADQTADVLEGIPGVTFVSGGGSRGVRIPQLTARPGFGCDNGPKIFLDNHLLNPENDPIDLNTIHPADLLAAEIYRRVSEVPLKFGGSDAVCGAIVLWTKH
jgi:hypothetical protein